ncbi:HEPN domain-containing protein [Halostagnicola sp. A-GB9-2]|uniref:HEPN domain-containing protein n=1 Tax=Halostagnicola sp. A-GB9-2 TaxID=3048066 RepID=UPI0024C09A94|nr:HEPN domain-containing protein [Halostagnicola sp. A-GB9-2]MDJ1433584.1 HEPN domain-containing protein [Halostagnicola sp. A-GB9-2]
MRRYLPEYPSVYYILALSSMVVLFDVEEELTNMGESVESINRIKNEISSFIKEVRDYAHNQDHEIPQTAIFTSNNFRDRECEYFINKPSKLVRDSSVRKWFFGDLAEWLINHNAGFEIPPALDPDNTSQIKKHYQKRLFEFAKVVMNYTGTLHFSETDFYAAYNDLFTKRYSSVHHHRIIVPLPGLWFERLRNDSKQYPLSILNDNLNWGSYKISHLTNPTISKLTNNEMTGLQTYGTPGMVVKKGQTQKRLKWTNKLDLNLRVKDRQSFYDADRTGIGRGWTGTAARTVATDIVKQILTSIRLFLPERDVSIGPLYNLERSWMTHRGICVNVYGTYYTNLTQQEPMFSRNHLRLSKEQFYDFQEYYDSYGSHFDLTGEGLTLALNRLNQMYQKSNYQDKIVDCFIGLETTLLKDGGASSKIADRGTTLLRHHPSLDVRYIHDLLSLLTRIRNGIVHNNAQVGDYIDLENETDPPNARPVEKVSVKNIINQARSILGHVIREYAYLMEKEGKSIQEVNVDFLSKQTRD